MQIEDHELKIEPVQEEVFDLEQLIINGTDTLIPLQFIYPGTNKKVGVYIRPVTSQEFANATNPHNINDTNFFITIVADALYNKNKEPFSKEFLAKLPAGVVLELYKKIAEISGIPTEPNSNQQQELVNRLMGF